MAERSGLSKVHDRADLAKVRHQAALNRHVKLSTEKLFMEKEDDVVGLYHHPPQRAVVLCVDEKSGIQPLDRSQPVLPMMQGEPERRSHTMTGTERQTCSKRTTTPTALSTASCAATKRDGEQEETEKERQGRKDGLEEHMNCDNHKKKKKKVNKDWLERQQRYCLHYRRQDRRGTTRWNAGRKKERKEKTQRREKEREGTRSRHPRLDREVKREKKTIRKEKERRRDTGLTGKVYSKNIRRGILVPHQATFARSTMRRSRSS